MNKPKDDRIGQHRQSMIARDIPMNSAAYITTSFTAFTASRS